MLIRLTDKYFTYALAPLAPAGAAAFFFFLGSRFSTESSSSKSSSSTCLEIEETKPLALTAIEAVRVLRLLEPTVGAACTQVLTRAIISAAVVDRILTKKIKVSSTALERNSQIKTEYKNFSVTGQLNERARM